jgi:hypothetical protein
LEEKGLKVEILNRGLEVVASGSSVSACVAREGFHRALRSEGASFPEMAGDGKRYNVSYVSGYDKEKKSHGGEETFGISVGNPGTRIKVVLRKI